MSTHKYGDITIQIDSLQVKGDWEEYGIRISAPGRPTESFSTWHAAEKDKQIVAQVLIYDLIEAYEDPQRFLHRMNDKRFIPSEYVFPEQNREFIRVANNLKDLLHQAHLDVYKEWGQKPRITIKELDRSPREWMPVPKKK